MSMKKIEEIFVVQKCKFNVLNFILSKLFYINIIFFILRNTSSYSGRRIVDFMFLIEQMKNSQHNDFGCSFLDMELVCETQYGFRSSFHFVCKICDSKLIIHSEKKDPSPFIPINEAIVNGTISAGLGYSQLAELSASADLHCMSSSMYGLVVSKYSNEINNATLEEMINSGKEERKLAIEAGDIDENGIPICFVIADHQWLNCCFKKKDDEFSGIVSIRCIKYKYMFTKTNVFS